jgi:His-Xaa-Ser system radical SAM maturase HxsB
MKDPKHSSAPFDFCFEQDGEGYIVSSSFGAALRLTRPEFQLFRTGKVKKTTALFHNLETAGLLRERLDFEGVAARARKLSAGVYEGPCLHILVLTLKCNHACVYCRATAGGAGKNPDMSRATAIKSVNTAFCSPNKKISLEFQGGEALLNWPVLRETVLYAKKLNLKRGKDLALSVVTNLSLMDREKFKFLAGEGVSVCTSLDGPAGLHNAVRRWSGGSSHSKAVYWLKEFAAAAGKDGRADTLPSALMTTTRLSLKNPRGIIDEYRNLGLGGIFLRPLSPIGYAGEVWPEIGYGPREFLDFYRAAVSYIMEVNAAGEKFVERGAALLARKILRAEDPNFLDLRSPCGAAIGQLAYNFNGDVYTCDEGRMAAACGDTFFRLGKAGKDRFEKLMTAPAARLCAMVSCLENQPYCSRCAFKPFCGVCPVHNYSTQGSPWGDIRNSSWCALQKGMFKTVFAMLEKKKSRKIIESWLTKEPPPDY